MEHLQPFYTRAGFSLPTFSEYGWVLKRYAILADGRSFDEDVAIAASTKAVARLPQAGSLADKVGNHGVGFQIIHFAEIAVVSPVFYWRWGSVLAKIDQLRASWNTPTEFSDGVNDVIGCIWEMDVVSFEIETWRASLLSQSGKPEERLETYLNTMVVQTGASV